MKTLIVAGVLAGSAWAQFNDVPPILQLVRKPGMATLSSKPYSDAHAAVEVIGLTAVTGLPETWLLEAHNSFTSIEALDQAMAPGRLTQRTETTGYASDELLGAPRTAIATFRGDWSYHPMDAVRLLPRARYFHVSIYRVRPGEDDDLSELMLLRQATADSINLRRPDLVYHVISGEPSGVYVVLAPLVSLKIMDDGLAALPTYAEPIASAESKARKKASAVQLTREHFLFRVDPRISYVSDEFAAADTEFWRGKRP